MVLIKYLRTKVNNKTNHRKGEPPEREKEGGALYDPSPMRRNQTFHPPHVQERFVLC